MFRYKRGIDLSYERQGYVYFSSRSYAELPAKSQAAIRAMCEEHGGAHSTALFEFVTTDATATALMMKHYISKATLYRAVKRYYEGFPKKI